LSSRDSNTNQVNNVVFISCSEEDYNEAKRLYDDLKKVGANPWLNKEDISAGKNKEYEIKKGIKNSRYFIALLSSKSLEKPGSAQSELKYALDKQSQYSESSVFIIPVRLDDCTISDQGLEEIQYVNLFPDWDLGFKKMLQAIEIDKIKQQVPTPTNVDEIKRDTEISLVNRELALAPSKLGDQFKGEKQFFVGRQEYLNEKIKSAINFPGSRVSIIGPGGSGKSQLAFKAIHQYEKERIFDLVIPIYFDLNLMPLSQFLSNMAENMGILANEFDKYDTKKRIAFLRNSLSQKRHPLIFLDNYETISSELNDKSKRPSQSAIDINNFLNDNIPKNASVLITSREKYNKLREEPIDLDGLNDKESMDLFNGLVAADMLLKNPKNVKTRELIEDILKKTGGHPLSIELIAKNITSIENLEGILESLGTREVNWAAPEARFRSLQACFGYTISKLYQLTLIR
jgi:hypothetical protein